jgi:superfamily I DNA/RNA helicase/Zn-dependent peptidase ImmA (M78 family)/CRISPR/Cas system-associated exonuclease Cas4 (RecB family)
VEDLARPRHTAHRLLRWLADELRAPLSEATPIDALAERLGLDVALFPPQGRRTQTLGWLEPGENLIFLRDGLPEPVRRFTLAHEIGHAVLHRPGGLPLALGGSLPNVRDDAFDSGIPDCDDGDFALPLDPEAATGETLGSGQAYSARARRESEANAFASALLLPTETLLAAYLAHPYGRRPQPRMLARRFGVSEDMLLRRLADLLALRARNERDDDEPAPVIAASAVQRFDVLDRWQRAAAEANAPALVVAGPGTGKTSTLVARVAYLVRQCGVAPERILALTFSNKAANEMRERLMHLLLAPDPSSGAAVADLRGLPTVSTIHAFCGDLLRRYAPLAGLRPDFRLVSETDGYFLLRNLSAELALNHYQPLSAPALHFPTLLGAISRAKDELAGPERYAAVAHTLSEAADSPEAREAAEKSREVASIYSAYQAALDARGDADFGDLIRLAVRLLREQPDVLAAVHGQYQHILVDEFQDINRAMGVLLRTLASDESRLWAVGDANQAIYRFRGASPANLARFNVEYPAAQVHTLQQNYRSVPAVLDAAAGVAAAFLERDEARPLAPARASADGPALTLASADDEVGEMAGLAAAIRAHADDGRPLRDQVVLCRTRRQCQRVAAALADMGIATQLVSPLLDQPDVKDLLSVVALAAEQSGIGLLRAGNLPDHPFSHSDARLLLQHAQRQGVSPVTLLLTGLDAIPELSASGRRGLQRLSRVLAELRQAPDTLTGLARYVFGSTRLGARLLVAVPTGDERATAHALHLIQLLALTASFEEHQRAQRLVSGSAARPASQLADWHALLDYIRVVSVLRQEARSDNGDGPGETDERVRVLTVHASKGLEFPVVYVPGLADRRFPMQRRGNAAPLPPGLSEDDECEQRDPNAHLAEEACLFYVAVTRARDELILSHADRYGRMRYKPSPFLAPIAERLGDRLRHIRWPDEEATLSRGVSGERTTTPTRAYVEPLPAPAPDAAISPAAIETYGRCPRQFAYRYVYGLKPREIGMMTLRRALHNTLRDLRQQVHFAAPTAPDANGDTLTGTPGGLTLRDTLALFETHWHTALLYERGEFAAKSVASVTEGAAVSADPATAATPDIESDPFVEVYRRHGRQVIERAWLTLTQATPPQHPVDELDASARFEHSVTVQIGNRQIALTVDRVEPEAEPPVAAPAPTSAPNGRRAGQSERAANAQPLRYVRHRVGPSRAAQADLRALLYTLAAEQTAEQSTRQARPVLYQHNLSTGEVERVELDTRKLTRLRENLVDILAGMESGIYPPRPDPNTCQNCPFLLVCPA